MLLCDAPGQLPDGIDYRILGTSEREMRLAAALRIARPRNRFLGHVDSLQTSDGALLVVCDPQRIADAELGCEPDALVIMPVPEGDEWSYFEFGLGFAGSVQDGVITLDRWRDALVRFGRARAESGVLKRAMWFGQSHLAVPHVSRRIGLRSPYKYFPNLEKPYAENKDFVLSHGTPGYNRREYVVDHIEEVNRVRSSLSDSESRHAYDSVLTSVPQALWDHYLARCFNSLQYFEYLDIRPDDVVLNAGVFTGCEIPFLLMRLRSGTGHVHNVDPLGDAYLTPYARQWAALYGDHMTAHSCALSDEDGELAFAETPSGQYYAGGAGAARVVRALTVESFVTEHALSRVDVLKFDLEGAEASIVPTLEPVIRRFRPQLAVSIYHALDHYWTLPRALIEACDDYNFYFNVYSTEQYEGVFYCVPRERDTRCRHDRVAISYT